MSAPEIQLMQSLWMCCISKSKCELKQRTKTPHHHHRDCRHVSGMKNWVRDRMGKQAAQQWDGDHLHLITLSCFLSPTLLVLIHPPLLSTQLATSHYGGPHSGNWSKDWRNLYEGRVTLGPTFLYVP